VCVCVCVWCVCVPFVDQLVFNLTLYMGHINGSYL